MRVFLACARGLLGGWLIAATAPLLAASNAVALRAGVAPHLIGALAVIELLGAALFAFEASLIPPPSTEMLGRTPARE